MNGSNLIVKERRSFDLRRFFSRDREYNSFDELWPKFMAYAKYDKQFAVETLQKYEECMKWIRSDLPHIHGPTFLQPDDILTLKRKMQERGAGPCRINSIIFTLRSFLRFCREVEHLNAINPSDIKPIKKPKAEVVYLSVAEINQLLDSIDLSKIYGIRTRALMELLVATGMRISEALSLDKEDIDWEAL